MHEYNNSNLIQENTLSTIYNLYLTYHRFSTLASALPRYLQSIIVAQQQLRQLQFWSRMAPDKYAMD